MIRETEKEDGAEKASMIMIKNTKAVKNTLRLVRSKLETLTMLNMACLRRFTIASHELLKDE